MRQPAGPFVQHDPREPAAPDWPLPALLPLCQPYAGALRRRAYRGLGHRRPTPAGQQHLRVNHSCNRRGCGSGLPGDQRCRARRAGLAVPLPATAATTAAVAVAAAQPETAAAPQSGPAFTARPVAAAAPKPQPGAAAAQPVALASARSVAAAATKPGTAAAAAAEPRPATATQPQPAAAPVAAAAAAATAIAAAAPALAAGAAAVALAAAKPAAAAQPPLSAQPAASPDQLPVLSDPSGAEPEPRQRWLRAGLPVGRGAARQPAIWHHICR